MLVKTEDLGFAYNRRNQVLDQLNIELPAGRIAGLLGANGTGKSTLMQILAGVLFPSRGNLEVVDHSPSARRPEFLRNIYFLPEETYLPNTTGDSYVRMFAPFYPNFDRQLFVDVLARLEVRHPLRLSDYSFGQKRSSK
jgi:ABC-type multidrug transport system, ATPase component